MSHENDSTAAASAPVDTPNALTSNVLTALVTAMVTGQVRVVDLTHTLAPEFPQIVDRKSVV